ncbi:MAG: hypothetical protein RLY70_163 [Planctomycetota bacterium]
MSCPPLAGLPQCFAFREELGLLAKWPRSARRRLPRFPLTTSSLPWGPSIAAHSPSRRWRRSSPYSSSKRCSSATNQSVPGTDRAINNRACPIHLVYRRAEGDGRASQPIRAEQTNPCQVLIATVDGQDVRRTREGRPDPSIRKRHSVLYDGHLVRREHVELVGTNPCQALIATVDGQDVRRTRDERPDPSIPERQPVLYDGMSQTPPLAVYTEKPAS